MESPTELLRKANQEANETRIKLNTLKACYENIAQGFHTLLKLKEYKDKTHNSLNFKDCKEAVCKSNYEVLTRLGLI